MVRFLKGRLRFSDGKKAAPFASVLAIWGASPAELESLDRELRAWRSSGGSVPQPMLDGLHGT
jgi:hypothetical protein